MAKRGLKLFGMGLGTLLVLTAIVVGILFATGVIKFKDVKENPDSSSPTGKSTDMIDAGRVTISNLTNLGRNGVTYHAGSTCKDYVDCSIVIKYLFVFNDGSQDVFTETYPGPGGQYTYMFTKMNRGIGQTRIPVGLEITGHSVVNGIKGEESGPAYIMIPK